MTLVVYSIIPLCVTDHVLLETFISDNTNSTGSQGSGVKGCV